MNRQALVISLAFLTLSLAACGSGGGSPGEPATATPVTTQDVVAQQVAIQQAVAATLTAAAGQQAPPAMSTPIPPSPAAGNGATGATDVPPAGAAAAQPTCVVQLNGLNVRSGPGTIFAPPVAALPAGTALKPLAFVARGFPSGQWIEVQAGGLVGWVSASQQSLSCNFDPTTLPAGAIPPTPAPTATPVAPTNTPPPQLAIAAIDVAVGGPSGLDDLAFQVIVPGILPPSAKPKVSGQDIVFRQQVVLQVKARVKSKGSQDGAGIKEVRFDIDDGGDTLFTQKEHTAGFCMFGGGEPTCNILTPTKDLYWPGTSTPVQFNHRYTGQINITRQDGTQDGTWNFSFTIEP
jgi:hypothetical protein